MTYPHIDNYTLISDESFGKKLQSEHHSGMSPLCNLTIDMVKAFPNDYMHQCCLGSYEQLLLLWFQGNPSSRKLSAG